jgi:4'-phosphopantetheinyl transferase
VLAAGECRVWTLPVADRPEWEELLSPAEREYAAALRPVVRNRFVTSRAGQRLVLADCLGVDPTGVPIERACGSCGDPGHEPGHGRPRIAGTALDFGVSHAADLVLVAVVGSGRVGVDVEAVRSHCAAGEVADRVLAPAERRALDGVPDLGPAFLACWTRTEAALKATGAGLRVPPASVDTTWPVVAVPGWPTPLHLRDLEVGAGLPGRYVAALATTEPLSRVVDRPWSRLQG